MAGAGGPPSLPGGKTVSLTVVRGPDSGIKLEFSKGKVTLGRKRGELLVRDRETSGMHASIEATADGRFVVKDLGSTNGTFLDGRRVTISEIVSGQQVKCGANYMLFTVADDDGSVTAHGMEQARSLPGASHSAAPPPQGQLDDLADDFPDLPATALSLPPVPSPPPTHASRPAPAAARPLPASPATPPRPAGPPPGPAAPFPPPRKPVPDLGASAPPRVGLTSHGVQRDGGGLLEDELGLLAPAGPTLPAPGPAAPVVTPPPLPAATAWTHQAHEPTRPMPMGALEPPTGRTLAPTPSLPAGVSEPLPPGIAHSVYGLYLIVERGRDRGSVFPIVSNLTVLGRSETDVVLNDPDISRRHAALDVQGQGHYVLRDLASTNGTLLNGIKVDAERIADNDKIRMGGTTIKFVAGDGRVGAELRRILGA